MKRKFCMMLVAISAMALIVVSSGFACDLPSVDGQYSQVMMATNTGGTPPTEIVAGQTTLLQASIPATINSAGTNTSMIINNTQDASQMNSGSGANLVIILAANAASSGGDNFHVGKHFVASTPIKATSKMMTTSIAT